MRIRNAIMYKKCRRRGAVYRACFSLPSISKFPPTNWEAGRLTQLESKEEPQIRFVPVGCYLGTLALTREDLQ